MKTQIQTIAIVAFVIASMFSSVPCNAQVDYTYDEEGFFSNPLLWLDNSHDLVRLTKDGNEVQIEIFMFDANQFDSVPNTLDFELLENLATAHDRFDIDLDDIEDSYFGGIVIAMEGGDDVLYTDPDLEFNLYVLAGDGDDFIQGGSGNDLLMGDRGSDRIFGYGGNDHLEGGNEEWEIEDYERDYLWGGSGADIFIQPIIEYYPRATRVSGLGIPGMNPTAARVPPMIVSFDRIMDFQSWQDEIETVEIGN